jgi:aspartyl protease family protein
MWRYFFLVLLVLAVAPLAPKYLEQWADGRPGADSGPGNRADVSEDDPSGSGKSFKIPMTRNGQYVTEARINGREVTMLVDTGASQIALPEDLARKIGIFLQPSDYKTPVQTANGIARAAATSLRELRLGPIRLKNVDALVLEDGLLSTPLLGMSALGKLERFDISNDTLILVQ